MGPRAGHLPPPRAWRNLVPGHLAHPEVQGLHGRQFSLGRGPSSRTLHSAGTGGSQPPGCSPTPRIRSGPRAGPVARRDPADGLVTASAIHDAWTGTFARSLEPPKWTIGSPVTGAGSPFPRVLSPSRRRSGEAVTASPWQGRSNAAESSDGLCCRREPQSLCGALVGTRRWSFGEALKRPGEVLGITGAKEPDPGLTRQSVREVLIMVGHDEGHAVSGRVEHRSNLLGPPWRASHESAITGSVDSAKFALGDRAGQIHHSPTAARHGRFQLRRPHRDTADDQRYRSSEELESPALPSPCPYTATIRQPLPPRTRCRLCRARGGPGAVRLRLCTCSDRPR